MFYNIEITPWLHITPDLQLIIDPGASPARMRANPRSYMDCECR